MADVSKRLEKATQLLQKGRREAALDEYLNALAEDPRNEVASQAAADLLISLNRTAEASRLLSATLDRQLGGGTPALAIATFHKLQRTAQPSPEQYFRVARLLEQTHNRDALKAFRSAAEGFLAQQKRQEALEAWKRVASLEPTLENLGQQAELAKAVKDTKAAISALLQMGKIEERNGRDPLPWFEQAYDLDPNHEDAALAYGTSLMGDATAALGVLEKLAARADSRVEFREAYARSLIAAGRPADAEPVVWSHYQEDAKQLPAVAGLIGSLLDRGDWRTAIVLARKAEAAESAAGRADAFLALMKDTAQGHAAGAEFWQYIVDLLRLSSREQEYSDALTKLFEVHFAAGNFMHAADCWDQINTADPYAAGHEARLEMLRGKVHSKTFNSLIARLPHNAKVAPDGPEGSNAPGDRNLLDDFLSQAEISVRYSMPEKAVERLQLIDHMFPGEEEKNERLRQLHGQTGFAPKRSATQPADQLTKVSEITRKISRQGNGRDVLFVTVNDIGRQWECSRCCAALAVPGKAPSMALEYCAPGVKRIDAQAVVQILRVLYPLIQEDGGVNLPDAQNAKEVVSIHDVLARLETSSLLAVPLADGDTPVGILMLHQNGARREWSATDQALVRSIADHAVMTMNTARLRSLMKTIAAVDEQSGLLKRSSVLDFLIGETRQGLEKKAPLSVVLLHFGSARELLRTLGEERLEKTMKEIGQTVTSHIRHYHVAAEYGLTTIALLLPGTDQAAAERLVQNVRNLLLRTPASFPGKAARMTAGIAQAVMDPAYDPADIVTEVIYRCENALEQAKSAGRETKTLPAAAR